MMFLRLVSAGGNPVVVNMSKVRWMTPAPEGTELVFENCVDHRGGTATQDTLVVIESINEIVACVPRL
jgi:hypothetical protein